MTIEDLFLLLLFTLALIIGTGTLLLRIVGFSFGKGALITTTFLFLGFWNPIGWLVLGACIWLQVKENRERLELARARSENLPRYGETRIDAGAAQSRAAGRPLLRRGDRC